MVCQRPPGAPPGRGETRVSGSEVRLAPSPRTRTLLLLVPLLLTAFALLGLLAQSAWAATVDPPSVAGSGGTGASSSASWTVTPPPTAPPARRTTPRPRRPDGHHRLRRRVRPRRARRRRPAPPCPPPRAGPRRERLDPLGLRSGRGHRRVLRPHGADDAHRHRRRLHHEHVDRRDPVGGRHPQLHLRRREHARRHGRRCSPRRLSVGHRSGDVLALVSCVLRSPDGTTRSLSRSVRGRHVRPTLTVDGQHVPDRHRPGRERHAGQRLRRPGLHRRRAGRVGDARSPARSTATSPVCDIAVSGATSVRCVLTGPAGSPAVDVSCAAGPWSPPQPHRAGATPSR